MYRLESNSNPVMLSVLGICPLLAPSTTLLTGLSMGLAALFVLILSSFSVSACKRYIPHNLSLAVILVISVTWASVLDMYLAACCYDLRQQLGMYIPLLAMNSLVLLSLEQTALREGLFSSLKITLRRGLQVICIVSSLGALRELLGSGRLLADVSLVLPGHMYLSWSYADAGYTVLLFSPGALIGFGLLMAAYRRFALDEPT